MIKRAVHYAKRHGLLATMGRAVLAGKRLLSGGRLVLFSCDLNEHVRLATEDPSNTRVERKNGESEVAPQDLAAVIGVWNPEEARKLIHERFGRGASLWLFKLDGEVAGYGWTLIGSTIEPHFYPVNPNDAHLFDFFVMAKYRGRGINPVLVRHILGQLAGEKRGRALIEAAEWNAAQLKSLTKTPFKKIGLARKFRFLGRTRVIWSR